MVDKEEDLTKAKFNHHKLKEYLEGINASLPDIDPKVYTSCMLEFVKIFNIIGSALSIAFSGKISFITCHGIDITSKSAIIRKNFAANPDFKGGIISFIKMEEGLKVQRCNGENNKKEAPSKEWMEYTSTTRTVLRLMWFFDYVSTFLGNLAADKKESVSGCSKDAYDKALGPHHPFPVRAGAKLAMTACPNRVKLFKGMFGDLEDEKIYEFLNLVVELVDPIRKNLWKFYEENNLTELP